MGIFFAIWLTIIAIAALIGLIVGSIAGGRHERLLGAVVYAQMFALWGALAGFIPAILVTGVTALVRMAGA